LTQIHWTTISEHDRIYTGQPLITTRWQNQECGRRSPGRLRLAGMNHLQSGCWPSAVHRHSVKVPYNCYQSSSDACATNCSG